ncbi:hypothetical protein [Chitinophaga solisilvae]|uniref:hypothetical protein n=1 Tax=Chitinophaga solisilvae TaxID=1233460 RepID=UPI001368E99E|nr:hypothetical protein [Chitinophaga solisilvae]
MLSLKAFIERERISLEKFINNRRQELSGVKTSDFLDRYAILITMEVEDKQLLLEHEKYKGFKKSTDLYYKHPEDTNIPVQAHYHVVNARSGKEIYAVNMDGTAHHRVNKGFQVPAKQAAELRSLGVKIPDNNLLESIQFPLNESEARICHIYIILEG